MEPTESFAEKLMRKQGWTDGQGLGRHDQGIIDPVKATLKFDTTGIGHDMAKEFTNNWWDLAYKKAANKIEVEELKDGQVDVKSKKKKKKKRKLEKAELKNKLYAGFTKSATLTNGKMVEEGDSNQNKNDSSSEDEEMDKFSAVTKLLSDETLFKEAGITAHKGARHGCTMQAKNKRVEESDKRYLEEQAAKKLKKKQKKKKKRKLEKAEEEEK